MGFETAVLGFLGALPLIVGLVEAAKQFGVEGKGSFILALSLGFVFFAYLEAVAQGFVPELAQSIVVILVVGLGGGLAATGLYDLGTGRNREDV